MGHHSKSRLDRGLAQIDAIPDCGHPISLPSMTLQQELESRSPEGIHLRCVASLSEAKGRVAGL